ncbi:hypothetical protein [Marinobacter sp.]|uniref:hypothetical protein n=1 Tax=Marinobacter sp. TaxID=50741 RepID=UPI003F97ED37
MDPVVGEHIIDNELPLIVAGQITFDPTPVREAAYHVLFSGGNPKAESLRDRFNDGLATLKATGRLKQLLPDDLPLLGFSSESKKWGDTPCTEKHSG